MTETRRIILNIIVSYGRTLLGVVCGIFSTRWVLGALGHEDFGIFGVVGSLVIFVTFLNTQFSGAVSRFYAFAIGRARTCDDQEFGLEECRKWFSTAVMIHTILPIVLVAIGYPLGVYAITSGWLVIPIEKVGTCIWLWRFMMISCFVGMISVPFVAMYGAKQYIAEITVYSIVQVIVKTGFIYYMAITHRDWLRDYGIAMCLIAIIPQLIICWRAMSVFPECHIRISAFFEMERIKELAIYAWWQMFCGIGYIARHQGMEIVVNKFFGPRLNAAYTIGATVGSEAAALTGAMNSAFTPAVTTAYGAGDKEKAKAFAFRASKFGTFLTLLFAIPMALEIKEVLRLWLKTPPEYAEGLCLCWLTVVIVEKFTLGQIQLVNASGDVAKFYLFRSVACLTAIPFSLVLILVCHNVYLVGIAFLLTTVLVSISDAVVARVKVRMSLRVWIGRIILPMLLLSFISSGCGLIPRLIMEASMLRVFVTSLLSISVLTFLSWIFLFDYNEKAFIKSKVISSLQYMKIKRLR